MRCNDNNLVFFTVKTQEYLKEMKLKTANLLSKRVSENMLE